MSSPEKPALEYPFMRAEFIQALENSGSACTETGWEPIHLSLSSDNQDAFMPLYLKDHSMGEYVFDYAWANAYHQNGAGLLSQAADRSALYALRGPQDPR